MAGDVPDRSRLLFDSWLPTRNRFPRRRCSLPIATLVLVLLTLFGALPVYGEWRKRVRTAKLNLNVGATAIAMEGQALCLVLLGFVATDFIITITLSAADATAHIVENPFTPGFLRHQIGVTIVLIALLGAVFLWFQRGNRNRCSCRRCLPASQRDCHRGWFV